MNCKVVYDGIEYSASDFEFMLASNLLPDLSITNTSDLNEVSENTIALAALPLLSDKINSVQQEELVNWLTAEVVGYSLKNASKDITPKELLTQAFNDSKKELEYCFSMVKNNMEERYEASGYGWDDLDKENELSEKCTRFLMVRDKNLGDKLIGFAHFRFSVQGDIMDQVRLSLILS